MRKVALVTGASRGIGRATAIALAHAGFDLAISARTVAEGDSHQYSVLNPDGQQLTGSLNETAEVLRQLGSEVLVVPMDLLNGSSVCLCVERVISHFGRIDLLINNGIYQGSDLNSALLDLQTDTLQRVAQAYLISPLLLVQGVLPAMIEQGAGIVINITSGAGESDPPLATGAGGWGYAYGAGKAVVSRLSGIISREHAEEGIKAYTVNPGVVTTETLKATMDTEQLSALSRYSATPEKIASVLVWLATNEAAAQYQYQTINAQRLAFEHELG